MTDLRESDRLSGIWRNEKISSLIHCIILLAALYAGGCTGESIEAPIIDPDIYLAVYNPDKAYNGTTLFADLHKAGKPRIVEVNMQGEIIWEYVVPESISRYTDPGFDVELLSNDNVLFVAPMHGVFEIDRSGNVIWSYLDDEVSHDADRLPNGNTIVTWGGFDEYDDSQVKEISPDGEILWSWSAKEEFYRDPYKERGEDAFGGFSWTHANSVTRLANGNTIISLRNFDLTVEVNPSGDVVWTFDWSAFGERVNPHEPVILQNGNLLIALHGDSPYQAVEINRTTGETLWTYGNPHLRTTRDADRLPNGNTLLVGVLKGLEESTILEVTPKGEVVWRLGIKDCPAMTRSGKPYAGWFYKAERIGFE
jgi:uncharacterized protein (UPF0248 family)